MRKGILYDYTLIIIIYNYIARWTKAVLTHAADQSPVLTVEPVRRNAVTSESLILAHAQNITRENDASSFIQKSGLAKVSRYLGRDRIPVFTNLL